MRISSPNNKQSKWTALGQKIKKNKVLSTLFFYNLFLAIAGLGLLLLIQPSIADNVGNQLNNIKSSAFNYFSSRMDSNPPHFKIDLKHKHYQRLAFQRQLSLEEGLLVETGDDEVPATLNFNNQNYKVKLRLKGKLIDHWQDEETMSLKVKVKNDQSIMGMRSFALQHPNTRGYLNEWVFQRLANYLDIINLRYEFVTTNINGKGENVYAIEEGLDKLLVESNQRKEGVILEFNTDIYWNVYKELKHTELNILLNDFTGTSIDGFQKKQMLENPTLKNQFIKARNLLEGFRKGELPTSAVFDIDKMAALFAIVHFYGNDHACVLGNIRFYFNPITARLEPIARDQTVFSNLQHIVGEGKKIGQARNNTWTDQLFADKAFFTAYLAYLEKLSDKTFLDDFFVQIEEDFEESLSIVQRATPSYRFPKELFYRNQEILAANMQPNEKIYSYLNEINKTEKKLEISIKNVCGLPIEVVNVILSDSITLKSSEEENYPFVQGSQRDELAEQQVFEFAIPTTLIANDSIFANLKVTYRFLGNQTTATSTVYPWPNLSAKSEVNDLMHAAANVENFKFLTVDKSTKSIYFQEGKFILENNLIFPADYTIKAAGSLELDIRNNANIISLSPIQFIGTKEQPILIHSSDSTSQGIVVMNVKKPSKLSFVHFDNLANPNQNNWTVSGAVTFYHSPVAIDHCHFSNNRIGDDLLNLVHSDYTMSHSVFKNTNADALDTDFSDGSINDCQFDTIGNDGIDISGSQLIIHNLIANNISDKGVSAGENSTIRIKNATISNSELAVTSKDKSTIYIEEVTIENCKVGFTVFKKKPEFGPGIIYANKVNFLKVDFPYLIEKNSQFSLENQNIPANRKNVEASLYGNEFGKSSR